MKRSMFLGAALAAGLLLTACGGSDSGTAAPAGTNAAVTGSATAAAPTGAATADDSTTGAPAEETTGAAATDTPAAGGAFDATTVEWFTAACSGLSELQNMGTAMSGFAPDSNDPQAAIEQGVAALTTVHDKVAEVANDMTTLPAPTIEGGSELASGLGKAFTSLAAALQTGIDGLSSADPSDVSSLTSAMSGMQTELSGAMADFTPAMSSIPKLPAEQLAQIKTIPGCDTLG